MVAPNRRIWTPALLGAALALGLGACAGDDDDLSGATPRTTASPRGGTFPISADQRICLRSDRPAHIYFTLTGSVPNPETADPRLGPTFVARSPVCNIPVAYDGMPLMFFAIDDAGNQEAVKVERYGLDGPPTCTANPPPGLYNRVLDVTISADEATATVLYTVDGSQPDAANPNALRGPTPFGPIRIDTSTQLRWRCEDPAGNIETIRSGQYTIDMIPPISAAEPPGGFYTTAAGQIPLTVTLRIISNDTGVIYYTRNGAKPVANDPWGHTDVAPLQAQLSIDRSSILRFTSVDQAGNTEDHGEAEFNEAIYIVDNRPLGWATPPGGRYSEDSILVELGAAPTETVLTYSINGSPFQAYTGPITLSGREVELRIRTQTGAGVPETHTEIYELGVATVTADFTESFNNTNNIDINADPAPLAATTPVALIEGGAARLPRTPVTTLGTSFSSAELIQSPAIVGNPIYPWAQRMRSNAGGAGGYAFALNGGPANAGTGQASTGVQIYELGGSLPNSPTPQWRHTLPVGGAEIWHGLTTMLSSGGTPLLAVASDTAVGGSDQIRFYAIGGSAPESLGAADAVTEISMLTFPIFSEPVASAPLVAPLFQPGLVFANERGGSLSRIVALEVTGSSNFTVQRRGSITIPGTQFATAMHLVRDQPLNTRLAIATADCRLFLIAANDPDNLVLSDSTTVCGSGTSPTALAAFEIGGNGYVLVAYGTSPQIALVDETSRAVIATAILPDFRPGSAVWHMAVVNVPDATAPVLALGGGPDGLFFYDLADVPAIVAQTRDHLSYLQRATRTNTQAWGLHVYDPIGASTPSLFVQGFQQTGAGGTGDAGAWFLRIPDNLRDFVPTAFVQSVGLNPRDGNPPIRAIKFDNNDFEGQVSFFYSRDGSIFQPFNCCGIRDINPPSTQVWTQVWWRAVLKDGATAPVLRELKLRFDYD